MSELSAQQPAAVPAGPSASAPGAASAPGVAEPQNAAQPAGQAPGQSATPTPQDVEDFFTDPRELPAEVQPHFKRMQAAFTKGMQKIKASQQAIDAYEAFERNPVETISQIATRYGLSVSRGGEPAPQQPGANAAGENWQPESWQEVQERIVRAAVDAVQQQIAPVTRNVQQLQAQTIEQQLDQVDPLWRTYEADMSRVLTEHPTLVKDPERLYELSLPKNVRDGRAMQAALAKLKNQERNAQIEGQSPVRQSQPAPKPVKGFDAAVEAARAQGRQEGWYR